MPEHVPMHPQLIYADTLADEKRETEEIIAFCLEHLREVRTALGLRAIPRSGAYGSGGIRNRSAYCIGASIGTGAKHTSCDGKYHGARCTCDCHSATGAQPRHR